MRISCTGAKCAVTEVEYMASGAINYFTASFIFDNAWSDFVSANKLYGIFEGSDSVILTTLVYNSKTQTYDCDVPWETIKYQGELLVGAIGHITTPETKILTTNMAFGYKIPEGAATNASTGSQPSGLLLDVLEAAEQVSADADRAEADADRAEANADRAEAAKAGAESARDTAITAKNEATTAKTAAQTAETNAETAQASAELAYTNIQTAIAGKVDTDDIVNDLITGGTTVPLSAEQGKALNASISQLADQTSVPMTNFVTNGDFSDGTTGWGSSASTLSAVDNTLMVTGNGLNNSSSMYRRQNITIGHKYYHRANARATNANCASLRMFGDGGHLSVYVFTPTANQWYTFSAIHTATRSINDTFGITHNYADAATANGKVMEVQYVFCVDLTAVFGAGNEPTASEMDELMKLFPNSWFDGTITLTQKQILTWTLNLIRKNTNAIVALGGTIV